MSKIVKYDAEGNEVCFDYAVDAREAVASGQFFDVDPVKIEKKIEEPKVEKVSKKEKKIKEDEIPEDLDIETEDKE